jgi:hypothetical protein
LPLLRTPIKIHQLQEASMETANRRVTAMDMSKLPHYAGGGLIGGLKNKLFGPPETVDQKFARKDAELAEKMAKRAPASTPAPAAAPPTPAPGTISGYAAGTAMKEREKAAGLAKGGAIKGKGTGTSDDVPIMASNGEFMHKTKATKAMEKASSGVMDAINKIADGGKKVNAGAIRRFHADIESKKEDKGESRSAEKAEGFKRGGAIRKMADGGVPHMYDGGSVDEARRLAPYVNHRAPNGPTAMPPPLQLTGPKVGTAMTAAPYQPNFTMGANQASAPAVDAATDVRAKYNPANGSPEAKAWQASQTAAPPASTAPAGQPVAAPSAGNSRFGAVRGAISKLGSIANGLAAPVALGATAAQGLTTDTEQYAKRFGMENTEPGVMRDLGIRAMGVASDLGNTMGLGLPKALLYRDDTLPTPPTRTTAVPPKTTAVPPTTTATAPVAAAPAPGAIRRIDGGSSPLFTNVDNAADNAALMGRGKISAQNQGAAQGLNDNSVYGAGAIGRMAAYREQLASETAQADATNQGTMNKILQDRFLRGNRAAGAILAGNQRTATETRGQDLQAANLGAIQKLAQQKLGLETTNSGVENKLKSAQAGSAEQILTAQTAMQKPGNTPAQQAAAEETYARLSGKFEKPQKFTVINLPDTEGAMGTLKGGQAVIDSSGQIVPQTGSAAPKPAPIPVAGEVRNGFKFKGGNPNDKANWVKNG